MLNSQTEVTLFFKSLKNIISLFFFVRLVLEKHQVITKDGYIIEVGSTVFIKKKNLQDKDLIINPLTVSSQTSKKVPSGIFFSFSLN